jgi:hypothetical protein
MPFNVKNSMKNEVMSLPLHGEENVNENANKVIQLLSVAENESLQYLFSHHLFTLKNAEYDTSLKYLFIKHNVHLKNTINKRFLFEINGQNAVITTNVSKWLTWYKCNYVEENSGEIIEIIKESESLKKARARAIICLNTFDEFYAEAYRKHLVTCLFITLTRVPEARHSIRSFMKQYKKALFRSGLKLLGYVWVSEVSYKGNIPGGHWHYHLVISVERLHVKGKKLPEVLTQKYIGTPLRTGLWGQKSECTFVYSVAIKYGHGKGKQANAVNLYLNKYMGKESGAVLGVRRFGASKNITSFITARRKRKQGN